MSIWEYSVCLEANNDSKMINMLLLNYGIIAILSSVSACIS